MRVIIRVAVVFIFLLSVFILFLPSVLISARHPLERFHSSTLHEYHPIDDLIGNATVEHEHLLSTQTHGLYDAAAAYRARRATHPPPHFDKWVEYASRQDAIIIEELFDRIYNDLRPFWAVDPASLRSDSANFEYRISIRNGTAFLPEGLDHTWMNLWFEMIREIESFLPDVDLAFNHMDESRLLVPWDDISRLSNEADHKLRDAVKPSPSDAITSFPKLPQPPNSSEIHSTHPFTDKPMLWDYACAACPPTSRGASAPTDTDFTSPPFIPNTWPAHSYHGYVTNWTLAKDICTHPHLRNLHGAFIEPVSLSVSTKLFPLFGGSKLSGLNNEILLPAPAYWSQSEFYSGGDYHVDWANKSTKLTWRGAASGGRNHLKNWRHFHRHRFVAGLNGTQIGYSIAAQKALGPVLNIGQSRNTSAENFAVPDQSAYKLRSSWRPGVGKWVSSFSDTAFVHLECFPRTGDRQCDYTAPYYTVEPHTPMKEQYSAKYLPDIDGNSYSGRYPAFLRSNSLPIKATIYDEWHDSRLVPWKHFVPMDSTYVDMLGIMDYFLGANGRHGRDDVAERIATDGKEWAEKVLRREDMLIYVYRLVLEYTRITHDEREKMGYVGDLG